MNTADSSSAGMFRPKLGNTSPLISLIVNKEVTCSVLEIKKRKIEMLKVWDTETETTEVDWKWIYHAPQK